MAERPRRQIGLVLSGGGARGAYEAGVIHYIRSMLPKPARLRTFDIQCGSSVGAINTAFMVATADNLEYQGHAAREIWSNLRAGSIYRRETRALFDFVKKGGKGILINLMRRDRIRNELPHFPGFLDTSPFLPFLEKIIPWQNISRNISRGLVQALSISTTNVFTGRLELFVEKHPNVEYTGDYITHDARILPVHAMASAAIPIIFPTVSINGIAYTDGGLRLNTPMSPAIQLGADSLFVIGLHHVIGPGEPIPSHGKKGSPASLGQVLGRVMNSIFLDRTQYDLEQLQRINTIIDWSEELYGPQYLEALNDMLLKKGLRGDIASRGLKRLRVLRITPSEDIGELFRDTYQGLREKYFTSFEKFLVRLLDVDPNGGIDFLSYIAFIPEYLKKLIDLGFEDARSNHDKLIEFLEN